MSLPALGEVPAGATTVEQVVRARLSESVGGLRGSVEAALPTVAFVVWWTVTKNLRPSLLVAGAVVVVALLLRLAQRQTPRFALSSLFAVAIAAVFALRSGRAEDVFLPGILYSCGLLVLTLLTVAIRWPLVGFLLAAGNPEEPFAWRGHAGVRHLCSRLTLVLCGMYLVRVAVMLPLYLADQVGWLGVAKIALGWPLYAVAVAVMGAVLLTGRTPLDAD
ncbi:DUF3159 domain-containing protein [Angustibacter aerolatus]